MGCGGVPSDGASIRHGTSSTGARSSVAVAAATLAGALRNPEEKAFLVEEHTLWVVEVVFMAAVKQA
jgi:hypothetical protein